VRRFIVIGLVCVVGLQAPVRAQTAGAALVPGNTKLHISIPNFAQFEKAWKKTKVSQLFDDPKLKPFFDDLTKESVLSKLALDWDDVKSVAKGELSLASFPVGPREATHVMTLYTNNGKIPLMKLLAKVVASMKKQGYKVGMKEINGFTITTYSRAEANGKARGEYLFSFVKDEMLVAGDNDAAAAAVLERWDGNAADRLEQKKAFQEVRTRAKAQTKTPSELFYFLEPIGLAEIEQTVVKTASFKRGPDLLKILKDEGFTALQSIGGFISFAQGDYDILQRTAVYAPGPYQKSMRMLKTLPGDNFAPPDWVPADAARFAAAYLDVGNAFNYFGSFFDAYYGEGDAGTFEDIIKGLRDDPNGPQVDVAKELIGRLGRRVTIVVDTAKPIGLYSVRSLVAVETKDEKGVADALRRLMENDETVKRHDLTGGVALWEMIAQVKKRKGSKPANAAPKAPNTAAAVARGQLFLASDVKMLEKILTTKSASLATSADFERVAKELQLLGAGKDCLRSFSRPDEDFQTVYEMLRTNQLDKARSVYAQALVHLFGDNVKRVDTSKFPNYESFRQYLGPTGLYCVQGNDGWMVVGCALRKK
jgi:hypothetical protein